MDLGLGLDRLVVSMSLDEFLALMSNCVDLDYEVSGVQVITMRNVRWFFHACKNKRSCGIQFINPFANE